MGVPNAMPARRSIFDFLRAELRVVLPNATWVAAGIGRRAASAVCVIGVSEQDDRPGSQTLYNTMVYIAKDGSILGRHRKLMPTYQERFFWGMGNAADLLVIDTGFGRLGGLICFENHVTLFKAAMATKGEEIHAACWPGYWRYTGERMDTRDMSGAVGPWHTCDQDAAIREYAFETQTFVVSANLIQPPESVPDNFPYKESDCRRSSKLRPSWK